MANSPGLKPRKLLVSLQTTADRYVASGNGRPGIPLSVLKDLAYNKHVQLARCLGEAPLSYAFSHDSLSLVHASVPSKTIDSMVLFLRALTLWRQGMAFIFPARLSELLAYQDYLVELLSRHSWQSVSMYDDHVRQRLVTHPEQHLNSVFPDLVSTLLSGTPQGLPSAAHQGPRPAQSSRQVSNNTRSPRDRPRLERDRTICRNFNYNHCPTPCPHGRSHRCTACGSPGHGALQCTQPSSGGRSRPVSDSAPTANP